MPLHFSEIDECISNSCYTNATCKNVIGPYTCKCKKGYDGSGFLCKGDLITDTYYLSENLIVQRVFRFILFKNFCFVTLTRTLDREFLFSPFSLPPSPLHRPLFPLPSSPSPTYSRSFPGKVLDHVFLNGGCIIMKLIVTETRGFLI